MDVKLRGGWFARKLAETLDKLFLEVVGNVILLAEEDYSTS